MKLFTLTTRFYRDIRESLVILCMNSVPIFMGFCINRYTVNTYKNENYAQKIFNKSQL